MSKVELGRPGPAESYLGATERNLGVRLRRLMGRLAQMLRARWLQSIKMLCLEMKPKREVFIRSTCLRADEKISDRSYRFSLAITSMRFSGTASWA